jgi:SAM-dependent methyltransferase
MIANEWFSSWFDSTFYHQLYAHRDESEAHSFIDALIARLRPQAGERMLDLGCGAGRHARRLAARGFRVTGLDLSAGSIAAAKRFERQNLHFRRHDMRRPFGRRVFDCVFNLFTSFGYFDTAEEHAAVVRNVAAALKPGGRLVLDYLNVRVAARQLVAREIKETAGATFTISRWTDRRHLFKRIVVSAAGQAREHVERVACFTLADFNRMFAAQGLRVDAVYGDYHLNRFDPQTSPRLILVARKLSGASAALSRQVLANPADGLGRHAEI